MQTRFRHGAQTFTSPQALTLAEMLRLVVNKFQIDRVSRGRGRVRCSCDGQGVVILSGLQQDIRIISDEFSFTSIQAILTDPRIEVRKLEEKDSFLKIDLIVKEESISLGRLVFEPAPLE